MIHRAFYFDSKWEYPTSKSRLRHYVHAISESFYGVYLFMEKSRLGLNGAGPKVGRASICAIRPSSARLAGLRRRPPPWVSGGSMPEVLGMWKKLTPSHQQQTLGCELWPNITHLLESIPRVVATVAIRYTIYPLTKIGCYSFQPRQNSTPNGAYFF